MSCSSCTRNTATIATSRAINGTIGTPINMSGCCGNSAVSPCCPANGIGNNFINNTATNTAVYATTGNGAVVYNPTTGTYVNNLNRGVVYNPATGAYVASGNRTIIANTPNTLSSYDTGVYATANRDGTASVSVGNPVNPYGYAAPGQLWPGTRKTVYTLPDGSVITSGNPATTSVTSSTLNPAFNTGFNSYGFRVGNTAALTTGQTFTDPCTGETRLADNRLAPPPQSEFVVVTAAKKNKNPCKPAKKTCQQKRCAPSSCPTQCYTLPPRRDDCYPADPKPYELAYLDNFEDFNVGLCEENDYNYFTDGEFFVADDGKNSTTNNGLVINAKVFTKTVPAAGSGPVENGFLDHFKTWIFLNSTFETRQCGELFYELCIAGQTFNTQQQPYGDAVSNPEGDPRLAMSVVSMIDFENWHHFFHAITNDKLFAGYERMPFGREDFGGEGGMYSSYMALYEIGSRNLIKPGADFQRLGVSYDANKNEARWYIDGNLVFKKDRVGQRPEATNTVYLLAGEQEIIKPRVLNVGFGHHTIMDAIKPQNFALESRFGLSRISTLPYADPAHPELLLLFIAEDNPPEARLFGQGAILKTKQLKVEYRC